MNVYEYYHEKLIATLKKEQPNWLKKNLKDWGQVDWIIKIVNPLLL